MGEWLAVLEMLLEKPEHTVLIVSAAVALLVVGWLWRQCAYWAYRVRVAIIGLAAVCTVLGCQSNNGDVACVAFIALVVVASASIALYREQNHELEEIARHNDQQNMSRNPAKALQMLQGIDQSRLVGPQRERYERYEVYTDYSLGNNRVAKERLEDTERKSLTSPAFKHLFLHVVADEAGDCKESQVQLSKGMTHKGDRNTDALTKLQLEHSQAVLHINKGQYTVANSEPEKLINHTYEFKVTNKDFLNSLYYNYVINLTRIGLSDNGESKGWEAIERYARCLDPSDPADALALFNLKLLFMRQLGTSSTQKNKLYRETLHDFIGSTRFTKRQKVVGVASFAGICWFDRLEPTPVFDFFAGNGGMLLELDSVDRYLSCSNLRNLLIALGGGYSGDDVQDADGSAMSELAPLIEAYFRSTAEDDLEAWERALPAEAYRQRAWLLSEKAFLCLEHGDGSAAEKLLGEAVGLLEDNLLVLDAMGYRLRLARILVNKPERSIEQVRIVDKKAQEMVGNPSIGYIFANASLYYALTNMRDDCLRTYTFASEHKIPLDQYAPGDRMAMAVSAFCARFFLFLGAIDMLRCGQGNYMLSDAARAWVARYPQVPPQGVVILLARFMGYSGGVTLARRPAFMMRTGYLVDYCWLEFPEAGLAFDPMLTSDDNGSMRRVFFIDEHPMVAMGEIDYQRYWSDGFAVQPVDRMICTEEILDPGTRSVIEEVRAVLERMTVGMAPSKQELMDAYLHGIANAPIPAGPVPEQGATA